jgi:hypothetical protein
MPDRRETNTAFPEVVVLRPDETPLPYGSGSDDGGVLPAGSVQIGTGL